MMINKSQVKPWFFDIFWASGPAIILTTSNLTLSYLKSTKINMVSLWSRSSRSRRSRSPLASAHLEAGIKTLQESPISSNLEDFFKSHPKLNRVKKLITLHFSKTHDCLLQTKCSSNSCDTHHDSAIAVPSRSRSKWDKNPPISDKTMA